MRLALRVRGILASPASEWRVIAADTENIGSLYQDYLAILAAVPSAAVLVGIALAGGRYLGASALTTALMAALVSYTMALAWPIVTAVVMEKMAPSFKSDAGAIEALKLVAYASTPIWLAGLLSASIVLAPLAVLGWAWAIYLFYVGMPIVLKTPPGHVLPFLLVSALTVVVVNVVLRAIASAASLPYY